VADPWLGQWLAHDFEGLRFPTISILELRADGSFTYQGDCLDTGTYSVTNGNTISFSYATATCMFLLNAPSHPFAINNNRMTIDGVTAFGKTGVSVFDKMLSPLPTYDSNTLPIPKFVSKHSIDLSKIERLTRFRSGYGHDYSDRFETCRSMKHYFAPYSQYLQNKNVELYAPVDGTVTALVNEASVGGHQVQIRSTLHPAFYFIVFHVELLQPAITEGALVKAGDLLGHARLSGAYDSDMGVLVWTPEGGRYISIFETMTDPLFADFQARGITQRDQLIISKAQRDAAPMTCSGQDFVSQETLAPLWVFLN